MKRRKTETRNNGSLFLLFLFVVLSVVSVLLLRDSMLENAYRTGTAIAYTYAGEEQNTIAVYKTLLQIGTRYLDNQSAFLWTPEQIRDWMVTLDDMIKDVVKKNTIDIYAVVHGKMIAMHPQEGDDEIDVASADWYRRAIAADGEVIFTDSYYDPYNDMQKITVAKMGTESGCVLAFSISPETFSSNLRVKDLSEGSSYYLCDSLGMILYADSSLDLDDRRKGEYVRGILKEIAVGGYNRYNSVLYDPVGVKKSVYYSVLPNGWKVIITIPHRTILGNLNRMVIALSLILFGFFVITLVLSIRDWRLREKITHSNETVRVLGNSFYALYRINAVNATYEIIKASNYVLERIPMRGDYNRLMDVLLETIEPKVCSDFFNSFSLENIRNLQEKKVSDFGGDFRRLFGDIYKWVNVRILFDETLLPGEAVLCFRDVEREKVQHLQRTRLMEESLETARRSEENQDAFFSNMSHDMRTPLNAVIGLSELAQKSIDNPVKVKELLAQIRIAGSHLLELINDILEMSRIRRGKVTFNFRPFDLHETIDGCLSIFKIQAENEEKEFSVKIDIQNSRVIGDSVRINQVLINLLSNAFKFTRKGGHISLQVRQFKLEDYDRYQFEVKDDGIGMSAEFVERVFEPYKRETRFSVGSIEGTGLGMAIVKNLVTQMNGKIMVKSALDEGTRFTVTVPFEVVKEASDESQNRVGESANGTKTDDEHPGRGRRLLLAEDNDINRLMAEETLRLAGFEVTAVENGLRALEIFEQSPVGTFFAILLDMQMPVMDGCEAARRIRALERSDAATIPMIAVTANAFAEDIAVTIEAGMNAHISKPIPFDQLYRKLDEFEN